MITRQCVQLACCLTLGGILSFVVIIHLYIGVLMFTGMNRGDVSDLLARADHDCHEYPSQDRQFVKHIHQVWNTKEIPERFQPYVESCMALNPDYNHTIWIPSERRNFIKQHYPWFLSTYDEYSQEMMRIDAVRYFIMLHYGGIYLDIDMACKTSFDDIIAQTSPSVGVLLGATEPSGCGTAWLISKPRHPFFNFTSKHLVTEYHWYVFPYWTTLVSTGPLFLWRSYLNFPCKDQVHLVDPHIHSDIYLTHHHLSSWHNWDGPFFIFFDLLYKHVIIHFVNYPILVVALVCCAILCCTVYKKRTKPKQLNGNGRSNGNSKSAQGSTLTV